MATAAIEFTGHASKRRSAGPSFGQFILAMIVVTVLAGASGVSHGLLSKAAPAKEVQTHPAAAAPPPSMQLFDLPPVVTNLGQPTSVWVRLDAVLILSQDIAHPDVLGAQIADDYLSYLRTTTLSELQGPIGLEDLKEALNERAAARSNGKVKEVIIKTLVIQ
jgi:flagellar protein FliL